MGFIRMLTITALEYIGIVREAFNDELNRLSMLIFQTVK